MAGWVPRGSCGGRVGPAGKTSTDRVGRGVVPAVGVEWARDARSRGVVGRGQERGPGTGGSAAERPGYKARDGAAGGRGEGPSPPGRVR